MNKDFDIETARKVAIEIRDASRPKSITPNMVGGLFAILVEEIAKLAIDQDTGKNDNLLDNDNTSEEFSDSECRAAFVARMNEKAAEIGMKNTTYFDPTGRENKSTAHDMARCLMHASGYPRLQEIWSTASHEMSFIQPDGSVRHSTITHGLINTAFKGSYNPMGGKGGSLNKGRVMQDGTTLKEYVSNMSCILQSQKSPDDYYAITTMGYYADKATAYDTKIQAIKDVMAIIESGVTEPQGSRLDEIVYEGKTYRDIFVNGNYAPNINGGIYTKSVNGKKTYALNTAATGTCEIVTSESAADNYVPPYAFAVDHDSSVNITNKGSYDTTMSTYFAACSVNITRYAAGRLGVGVGTKDWVAVERLTDGYEVVAAVINPTATSAGNIAFYLGSSGSANLAGSVNNPVILNLNMFSTAPSEEQLIGMYNEFCDILREDYGAGESASVTSPNADYICAFKLPKYNARSYGNIELTPVYKKSANTQFYPASMTKMMTAMLTLDYVADINEMITLKQEDIDAFPTPNWYAEDILLGETVTIKDVLYIMMMPSSNIATEMLSRVVGSKILASKHY